MGKNDRALCLRLQEETLARIRADCQRASAAVVQLLEMIEQRLFDEELDVNALLRWCGRRDNNVLTRFAADLGLAPGAYIKETRMQLAARLLADTGLKVWEIAVEVGYGSPHRFGRAFKKWTDGKTPGTFRKEARSAAPEAPPVPENVIDRRDVRRAVAGELPPEKAEELSDRLYGLGDLVRSGYLELSPPADGSGSVETVMARNLWAWIEPLPYEVQLRAVESQAPAYRTPVLFHRLCTVSLEAEDDVTALQRASLALASLPAVAESLGEDSLYVFARAYAVAGHAQRRAGQLDEAGQSFGTALRMLQMAGDDAHPVVTAELCLYQSALEIELDNYDMARQLAEQGTGILKAMVARVLAQLPEDETP